MINYSIVRIAGFHFLQLVNDLYREHPELSELTYNEQQKLLFEKGYVP